MNSRFFPRQSCLYLVKTPYMCMQILIEISKDQIHGIIPHPLSNPFQNTLDVLRFLGLDGIKSNFFANNKGVDQAALPRGLISAFFVIFIYLKSVVCLATLARLLCGPPCKIYLAIVLNWSVQPHQILYFIFWHNDTNANHPSTISM